MIVRRHSKRARILQTNMPVVGHVIRFLVRVEPVAKGVLDNFVKISLR